MPEGFLGADQKVDDAPGGGAQPLGCLSPRRPSPVRSSRCALRTRAAPWPRTAFAWSLSAPRWCIGMRS